MERTITTARGIKLSVTRNHYEDGCASLNIISGIINGDDNTAVIHIKLTDGELKDLAHEMLKAFDSDPEWTGLKEAIREALEEDRVDLARRQRELQARLGYFGAWPYLPQQSQL